MRVDPSARFALRAATADCHARVDNRFGRCDLGRVADYSAFLVAQARVFLPVETALMQGGVERVLPDWGARRRTPKLVADLASLGCPLPPPIGGVAFADRAALLGGVYVLEGSRLGGAMLARSVRPGLPGSFLEPADPALWRGFVAVLDAELTDPVARDRAIAAAIRVFALFEAAGAAMPQEQAA